MKFALTAALVASAQVAMASDKQYISGEVKTTAEYLYGRFVTRMAVPRQLGTNGSFYTFWPGPNWSDDAWNEIDIEIVPSLGDVAYSTNPIYGNGNNQGHSEDKEYLTSPDYENFHEYRFDWTPDYINYYLDGVLVRNVPSTHRSV